MSLFNKKTEEDLIEEELNEKYETTTNMPVLTEEQIEKTIAFDMENNGEVVEDTLTKEFDAVELENDVEQPSQQEDEETEEFESQEDDDDEYEYVTPHYGRNAFLLTLVCMLIGACATFMIVKDSMMATIRANYEANGYMITSGATATASDIREGMTAYVRGQLVTGTFVEIDTTQATATAADILAGYTAYVDGVKITGTIPTYTGSSIITPSTTDYKIPSGYYIKDDIIVAGSSNLTAGNIRSGVNLFGITGTYSGD